MGIINPYRLGGIYDKETKHQAGSVWNKNKCAPIIDTMQGGQREPMIIIKQATMCYRIRKLTPMECWRLMDFKDEDFKKAATVVSNNQLYKQAGNSIVVNVLVAIIGQMIEGKESVYKER